MNCMINYVMVDVFFNIKNKYYKKMYIECGFYLKYSVRESYLY